jgi:hypothetical protein
MDVKVGRSWNTRLIVPRAEPPNSTGIENPPVGRDVLRGHHTEFAHGATAQAAFERKSGAEVPQLLRESLVGRQTETTPIFVEEIARHLVGRSVVVDVG